LKIIAVHFGETLAQTAHEPTAFHEPHRQLIFDPLMDALASAPGD
jgi:hypothetical protein